MLGGEKGLVSHQKLFNIFPHGLIPLGRDWCPGFQKRWRPEPGSQEVELAPTIHETVGSWASSWAMA